MKPFKRQPAKLPERRRIERAPAEIDDGSNVFRRGRTLTGSVSQHVRSLNESGADLKSPRVHTHTLTKQRRQLVGIFGGALILAGVLYVLVAQFTSSAVVRASPDPSLQLTSIYAEAIESYMGEHLSQRWRFMTDAKQLTAYVQAVAPEVKSITPRGSAGFGESMFEITFREPIASWSVGGQELFVDGSGIPFEKNYFTSPTLRITDMSGMVSTVPSQSVMSNRFMGYIGQVISLSKTQGYTVEDITIPEGMTRQITVRVQGLAYPIKFSSDRSAGEGVDDMVRTIRWMQARQLTPEYVDVRVEGRVFYR